MDAYSRSAKNSGDLLPELHEILTRIDKIEDVITSYSIHYTKLYESRRMGQQGVGSKAGKGAQAVEGNVPDQLFPSSFDQIGNGFASNSGLPEHGGQGFGARR